MKRSGEKGTILVESGEKNRQAGVKDSTEGQGLWVHPPLGKKKKPKPGARLCGCRKVCLA